MGGSECTTTWWLRRWTCGHAEVWLPALLALGLVLGLANLWFFFYRRNSGKADVQDMEEELGEQARGVADLRRALAFALSLEAGADAEVLRRTADAPGALWDAPRRRLYRNLLHKGPADKPHHGYPTYNLS